MLRYPFFWVDVIFLLSVVVVLSSALDSNCKRMGRVSHSEVLDQFRFLVGETFVGQDQAVDLTFSALKRFKEDDMLLFHFVGASGTGKTFFASLVQRSFFKLNLCRSKSGTNDLYCSLFQLIGLNQEDKFDTMLMHGICGGAYADFLTAENPDKSAKDLLENALETAFAEAGKSSRTTLEILFLDNFNECKHSCEKLMTKIVTTRRYRLKNNQEVPMKNVVILITSDLSQEGLRLFPDEDRRQSLVRILDVAATTWGEDSLWNDRARIIPFTPYSDFELARILDLSIREVEAEIASELHSALQQERKEKKIHGKVTWSGRFVFKDVEKQKLIDRLHRDIANKNCRAFDKIKSRMIAASHRPEPIELRLTKYFRPVISPLQNVVSSIFKLFRNARYEDWEYTQNLVFRTLPDDPNLIEIEIDDIDDVTVWKEEL